MQLHRAQVVGTPLPAPVRRRMPAACVITRGIGATSSADHRNFPTVKHCRSRIGGYIRPALLLAMGAGRHRRDAGVTSGPLFNIQFFQEPL